MFRSKRICIVFQIILLIWFFLDMIGVYFGNSFLVARSYQDDGVFFLIYLATVLLFIFKEKNRKMGSCGFYGTLVYHPISFPRMVYDFWLRCNGKNRRKNQILFQGLKVA